MRYLLLMILLLATSCGRVTTVTSIPFELTSQCVANQDSAHNFTIDCPNGRTAVIYADGTIIISN